MKIVDLRPKIGVGIMGVEILHKERAGKYAAVWKAVKTALPGIWIPVECHSEIAAERLRDVARHRRLVVKMRGNIVYMTSLMKLPEPWELPET
jgi:hypothetical protein